MQVSQYKQLFLTEAITKLKQLEDILIILEKHPDDMKAVAELLQHLHALKGDAATMNYQGLANAVHQVEELFIAVKNGTRMLAPDHVDACFIAIDSFRQDIESIRTADTEIDLGPAVAFTLRKESGRSRAARASEKAPTAPAASEDALYAPLSSYVDVASTELEQVFVLANDIVASQQQLQRLLRMKDFGALKIGLYNLATHASDLRKTLMDMKLIPVRQYFAFLARLVRDLARQQKKFITFDFKDNGMRFEGQLLESLREACVQLIKNAIDHGFSEGDRGVIRLSFDFKSDKMFVTVKDTGRGIDWEALEKAVLRHGLSTKQRLAKLKPDERNMFLISAGVSSREKASLVSGRGVGLPLVRSVIAQLHGSLSITSTKRGQGKGTSCELVVPLAPTLFRALTWRWGSYYLAMPLFVVEKIIQLPSSEAVPKEYRYRGNRILARTSSVYVDEAGSSAEHAFAVAIINYGGERRALFLPAGVREQELIAQSLPILAALDRVASVAVSEEGMPITIVNHRKLFEERI